MAFFRQYPTRRYNPPCKPRRSETRPSVVSFGSCFIGSCTRRWRGHDASEISAACGTQASPVQRQESLERGLRQVIESATAHCWRIGAPSVATRPEAVRFVRREMLEEGGTRNWQHPRGPYIR